MADGLSRKLKPSILILLLGFSLAALAKSKLITSWKNPQHPPGKFTKVLVIGMSAQPGPRADFEDDLSESLSQPGVEVIAGNTILLRPGGTPLNLDYLRTQIRDHHIDGLIVSRLVSVKDSVTYIPPEFITAHPYYNSFYGYYSTMYPVVYSPGYLKQEKKVRIETNVYAINGNESELVWTGTSDTFNPKDAKKVIKEVVKLVSKELGKDGVI
jgi:hypothetical protein